MRRNEALESVIAPIVDNLGLTWVGLQYLPQGKHSVLRLFIDKPGGVTIADCEKVTRQVNTVMSVESPISSEYTLEVSSPGMDRLFFSVEQCRAYVGKKVSVQLTVPDVSGKRNFKGELTRAEDEKVSIRVEEQELIFNFDDIHEMRLVPVWS